MKLLSCLQFLGLAAVAVTVSASDVPAGDELHKISLLELQAHKEIKILYNHLVGVGRRNPEVPKFTSDLKLGLGKKVHSCVGSFVFTNCGDATKEFLVASNVTLKPDPVKLPGNLTISADINIKTPFGSPVKADLKVWKEVLGVWVQVPCIDNFGSCTYDDFCKIDNPSSCPPEFDKIGLPCKCPFKAGSWSLPSVTINVPTALPVPITGGVRARLSGTYNGNMVTCVQVEFNLA